MEKIKIVIVDDHPMMRMAVRFAIEAESDMDVCGEAVNGERALALIETIQPDVVVMDLLMPKMDGLQAIEHIRPKYPHVHILVLSGEGTQEKVLKAVQLGAQGYLTKEAERQEIVHAIRTVANGTPYLPTEITAKLINGVQANANNAPVRALENLSSREQEILDLMGQGFSNARIGAKLAISDATVRVHLRNILNKLGLEDREQAATFSARRQKE